MVHNPHESGDAMKRRILLVDDEVAVLLTLKAVLEINGFDVDTAASAREGKSRLRAGEYHMIITDMRMENEAAGAEVIAAARSASYHPAVALLTAYPLSEEDWQALGADRMLVKPLHTRVLLQQIENLLASHEEKLKIWTSPAPKKSGPGSMPAKPMGRKSAAKPAAAKPAAAKGSRTKRAAKARKG
jgi:DNA-binding response OmpR family regulator